MMRTPVYGVSERHLQTFNRQSLRARCAQTSIPRITSPAYQTAVTGSAGIVSGHTPSQSWKNTGSRSCARVVLRTTLEKSLEVSRTASVIDVVGAEWKTYPPEAITGSLVANIGISQHYFQIFEELQLSCFSILLHCRK